MANINNAKDLDEVFVYHPPFGTQVVRYLDIRTVAKALAASILEECPPSRERSLALTHVQEAVMWANASIAVNEKPIAPAEHIEAQLPGQE